ncbi:uncharacterized protein LOC129780919 [Toxorhynchites rutilus septentrionalis]|uniref:uncharacterized protein LOC129780919 n=1 Tax=Toxorhynchites rutilus septentrionalis TaxID=329112 RepID=UPI00247A6995|nr:uncharacterized protein LOC129780919 [Toxorhynchites rutilus septentrionalis]
MKYLQLLISEAFSTDAAVFGVRNGSPDSSDILIYYQNVGGINSSLVEYQLALSDGSYDIYVFSETWLNGNTASSQLFDNSYSVYRQDRSSLNSNKRTGGGVLLAVHSRIKSRTLNPPSCSTVEHLWIAITTLDATLYLCVVYMPPDRVNDGPLINQHLDSLYWVVSQLEPRYNIMIRGNFNLSSISWQHNSHGFLYPVSSQSSICLTSQELLDSYCTAGLRQMIGIKNENDRILDLCFFNEELCEHCTVMQGPSPLVKIVRHHPPILVNLNLKPFRQFHDASESVSYDFSKTDFTAMNNFLAQIEWIDVFQGCDANLAASIMSSILLYAIDQFVPVKTKYEDTKPAWSNGALKYLKRVKQSTLRQFSKHRTDSTRAKYLKTNAEYKQLNNRLYLLIKTVCRDALR